MRKLALFAAIACVLIVSIMGFYFAPLTVTGQVNVWFSNNRWYAGDELLYYSKITSHGNSIEWMGNGVEGEAYIEDVSTISMSDGIVMWANDSLNVYQFPTTSANDEYYSSKLYSSVSNIRVFASKDGTKVSVPYSNTLVLNSKGTSTFVDLDKTDALLGVSGNMSYTLSIAAVVDFRVSFSALPFKVSSPKQITDSQNVNFGNITISCVNGRHMYAHVNFPYQRYSYSIAVPYVETLKI